MVHTPGSHLLTTNQTRTHRSQQSILLQLFFATQCYTSGSEIWDLHAKLGLFWDQIWTLVPFGTKSQIIGATEVAANKHSILPSRNLLVLCDRDRCPDFYDKNDDHDGLPHKRIFTGLAFCQRMYTIEDTLC